MIYAKTKQPRQKETHLPQVLIELWAPPGETLDDVEHFRQMLIDDIRHAAKHLPADWKVMVLETNDAAEPIKEAIERFGDAVVDLTRSKRTVAR